MIVAYHAELGMQGVEKLLGDAAARADADDPLADIRIVDLEQRAIGLGPVAVPLQFAMDGLGQTASGRAAADDAQPRQPGRNGGPGLQMKAAAAQ